MTDRTASLSFSDGSPTITFPILTGSVGPEVIDIRTLYGKTGKFTYDPGFLSTASCNSTITYIDGDKGELLYRGYPIEELATKCDFMEVCHLLLYGELPNSAKKTEFTGRVIKHTMVNEQMQAFLTGFRRDSHPMAVMTGLVGALSAFYPDSINLHDAAQRDISAIRLIAKMPTLVAMAYKYSVGQPYMYPHNDLSYAGNFMRMMFATPCEDYKSNDVLVRAMDRIFILHADHEQNASTSTVRLCASSGTNPVRGDRCRRGLPVGSGARRRQRGLPQHAGRHPGQGRRREDRRVHRQGQGQEQHRQADGLRPPRLQELRPARQADARDLPRGAGRRWACTTTRCSSWRWRSRRSRSRTTTSCRRKLYPNVDYYSGIVQKAIGIPVPLFTAIFALARTVGWIAQLNEMIADPEYKIGRPRQLFTRRDAPRTVDSRSRSAP